MAENTTIVTSSVISATSQHKRDYAERFRRLYPELTRMLALVKGSNFDAYGKPAYSGNGMIGKKAVKRMDPEWATYTPVDVMYLCSSGSSTTAVLSSGDNTMFQLDDTVVNTTTGEVGFVRLLDASGTTTLTITAVTGGTWSCNAGDYISMMASSFEEGTSRYANVSRELTTNKTYLQIFREGVSIADTVKNTPQYTNEGMMERYMGDKTYQAMRKMEGSFWFSKKATAGTTSVTIGGVAQTLYSMQGLLDYAGTAYDMQAGFNWETFNTVLYPIMPKTIKPDEVLYMAMGRKTAATMNQWANNSYLAMGSNSNEQKFGKKIKTYIMGGALEVEPLVMDLFDTGGYSNSAVFFQSGDLEYLNMEGLDLKVRENAQLPATMGTTNIIEGVVGLRSISAGASVKWISNLFAA
jgi:hypothetical protein